MSKILRVNNKVLRVGKSKGLQFDGINDYVTTTATTNYSQFSWIVRFVFTSSLIRNPIMTKGTFQYNDSLTVFTYYGELNVSYGNSNGIYLTSIPFTFVINEEYEIAISGTNVYINGILIGLLVTPGAIVTTTSAIKFSEPVSGAFYSKTILIEAKQFDKFLNATEVSDYYNFKILPSNLVNDWDFKQLSGNIVPDKVGGNNGAINNQPTPTWVVTQSVLRT